MSNEFAPPAGTPTFRNVAEFLAGHIDRSPKTQKQIAREAGFKHANFLSMLKSGEAKVPFDRIPALASALRVDSDQFMMRALQEYEPLVFQVISRMLLAHRAS